MPLNAIIIIIIIIIIIKSLVGLDQGKIPTGRVERLNPDLSILRSTADHNANKHTHKCLRTHVGVGQASYMSMGNLVNMSIYICTCVGECVYV